MVHRGLVLGRCAVTLLSFSTIPHYVLRRSIAASSWLLVNARDPDVMANLAWENAFYGRAYFLGYFGARLSVRLHQRLAKVLRARSEVDMLLREARLLAYRGQLQPELMLEALATLRCLSNSDPAAADTLVDRLVMFLRVAMPAVRTGRSTLMNELMTLETYSALRNLVPSRGAALQVRCERPVADLPFPPLTLLPALDLIAADLPPDGRLTLWAHSTSDGLVLRLTVEPQVDLPVSIGNDLNAALKDGKVGDAFFERPMIHEVENIGGTPARTLIIELKHGAP